MYIWLVLATFLAMIAAYFLPIRQDTQDILTVPVAQAKIVQLVTAQRSGLEYMKEHDWPYFGDEVTRPVDYVTGELAADDLTPYLPIGFILNANYITAIYCMDADGENIKTGADSCQKDENNKTNRLLITFGAIPEPWQNYVRNGDEYVIKPSPDMLQGLRNHVGPKEKIGYTQKDGDDVYIVTYENEKFQIPQPVAADTGVIRYTISNCIDDYETCLAYMTQR